MRVALAAGTMSISTRIVFALRTLFLVCMLAIVATGCAAEPDSQPLSPAEALASELVTFDDVSLDEAAFDEGFDEYDDSAAATTRPPDTCGGQVCPRYSHLCCVGHCVRRVEGIRCVDRGGGVRE